MEKKRFFFLFTTNPAHAFSLSPFMKEISTPPIYFNSPPLLSNLNPKSSTVFNFFFNSNCSL